VSERGVLGCGYSSSSMPEWTCDVSASYRFRGDYGPETYGGVRILSRPPPLWPYLNG
jgi:hypothetical protein